MHKLAALILTLAGGLAVPFVHHGGPLTRAGVERVLMQRENGGPNGHVTSSVSCRATGRSSYDCTLLGVRHTALEARVVVRGGSVQADWAALQG